MLFFNMFTKKPEVDCEKIHVTYLEHMGDDCSVVNAARVSFAKQVDSFSENDAKLVQYLARNDHWSPFAHTSIKVRVSAPIFLARQLVKHQVGGVWNEESRRYISGDVNYFVPTDWRRTPDGSVKQGSGGTFDNKSDIDYLNKVLMNHYAECDKLYRDLLNKGVCPEQARMVLPLGAVTHWVWTGSLLFWARVYSLRNSNHAQKDLKSFTDQLDKIMTKLYPNCWKALKDSWC